MLLTMCDKTGQLYGMPRTPRIQFEGAAYHIINRGNNREPIFIDEEDYLLYLQVLE